MVDSIKYTNPEHTQVLIEPENWLLSKPYPPHRQSMIDEWIILGNEIQAYNQYENLTIEDAYNFKEAEIDGHAYILIDNAYANPINDIVVDSSKYKIKVDRRRKSKADKLAGEIILTQTEKDEAKTDQKLSEYEIKITDDQEKAEINMYKLSTVIEIMAFDVAAESWNVWTPPV